MHSALYIGRIRHRRFAPKFHHFVYCLPFFYLDLDEIRQVFRRKFLMATSGPSILAFRRRNYLGDPSQDLSRCVRDEVEAKTGKRPLGPIRILTQISYFGFCFNPISLYYCFDAEGEQPLRFVVAQVTNTPWNRTHVYVVETLDEQPLRFTVPKDFHVSPFMPMPMNYHWALKKPGRTLSVRMENRARGESTPVFEATMALRKLSLSAGSISRILLRFPLLTARAYIAIYWQALLLFIKGIPYYPYPSPGGA